MPPKAASSCSSADDEFDDDGIDWEAAAPALDAAEKKVKAAAEREEKIQKLIKEAEQELQVIARLRKEAGSGRPKKRGAGGTRWW